MRVMNEKSWDRTIDNSLLQSIDIKPQGPRHQPINHGFALELFKNKIRDNNLTISKETGLLSPDRMKYVYVSDINSSDISDYTFTLGFVNYNNRQKSFTGLAGEKVFICSNECYQGLLVGGKRHTTNIKDKLEDKITDIINSFLTFRDGRKTEIDGYKKTKFTDQNVANIVLDLIRNSQISNTDLSRIVREWDRPSYDDFSERTAWSFTNAGTEVFKRLNNPLHKMEIMEDFKKAIKNELVAA